MLKGETGGNELPDIIEEYEEAIPCNTTHSCVQLFSTIFKATTNIIIWLISFDPSL